MVAGGSQSQNSRRTLDISRASSRATRYYTMVFNLTPTEEKILKKLSTPQKIQDYLDTLPMNHEKRGETHMSVRRVLREKKAHCIEGALLAAAALKFHGEKPLLMDLKARRPDDDHVVALFKQRGYWGAISKTNHAVLRYRDPVYKTLRELALSYFHEYFWYRDGKKMLVSYSNPLNLSALGDGWVTAEDELWFLDKKLNALPHFKIVPPKNARVLRPANRFERRVAGIEEWSS